MDAYQKLLTIEDFDLLLLSPPLLFYILLSSIPMFQGVFSKSSFGDTLKITTSQLCYPSSGERRGYKIYPGTTGS